MLDHRAGYVGLLGRPNAGKSTLLNALLGAKVAIVSPKAQTTRERLFGILTKPECQIIFTDTPGIHYALEGGLNDFMMHEAVRSIGMQDVIWYLIEPDSVLKRELTVLDALKGSKKPIFILSTKSDQGSPRVSMEVIAEQAKERELQVMAMISVSAHTGAGVEELLRQTQALLPIGPPLFEDQLSDKPERYFVAEKIREQLFSCLQEEIPYGCAVEIDAFHEKKHLNEIEATIFVERSSQQGIVIGKKGIQLKEIGTRSRLEIEDFLGTKVMLRLRVRTLPGWSKNARDLQRFGYVRKGL